MRTYVILNRARSILGISFSLAVVGGGCALAVGGKPHLAIPVIFVGSDQLVAFAKDLARHADELAPHRQYWTANKSIMFNLIMGPNIPPDDVETGDAPDIDQPQDTNGPTLAP